MKRYKILCMIFLFFIFVSLHALNLESFRHQSTYIIDDALDLAIDGTDIYEVEGGRIFTNLSNLSTGTEKLMGDVRDNSFVIGCVTPELFGLKGALLWGTRKALYSQILELDLDGDGFTDFRESGFVSGTWIRQWDANADDSLDFTDSRYAEASAENSNLESDILINIAKKIGKGTAALTYRRMTEKIIYDYYDSKSSRINDFNTGVLQEQSREDSMIAKNHDENTHNFTVSYEMPFKDLKLRSSIYLKNYNVYNMWSERYSYDENLAPEDSATTDRRRIRLGNRDYEEYTPNNKGLCFRLRNTDSEILWEAYGDIGIYDGYGYYGDDSYERLIIDTTTIAGNVSKYSEWIQDNDRVYRTSISGYRTGIGGKMEWQLSDNVIFGVGLEYQSDKLTREYDLDYTNSSTTIYDDGDSEIDDMDDYQIINTSGYIYTRTIESRSDLITAPVGLEINIGKNKDWFIRFGARAYKNNINDKEIKNINEVIRETTTIIYGESDTTVTYQDIEFSSTESEHYTEVQKNAFAYGLGWKPSENLSIDFLGMFDLADTEVFSSNWFRSLKLSAVVSFQ